MKEKTCIFISSDKGDMTRLIDYLSAESMKVDPIQKSVDENSDLFRWELKRLNSITRSREKEKKKEKTKFHIEALTQVITSLHSKMTLFLDSFDFKCDYYAELLTGIEEMLSQSYKEVLKLDVAYRSAMLNQDELMSYINTNLFHVVDKTNDKDNAYITPVIVNNSPTITYDTDSYIDKYYYLLRSEYIRAAYINKLIKINWAVVEKYEQAQQGDLLYDKSASGMQISIYDFLYRYQKGKFERELSKAIYCQRKKKGMTQKDLQEISGVDRTTIAKIEKMQQQTTIDTAIKLLSALDLGITIYSNNEDQIPEETAYE